MDTLVLYATWAAILLIGLSLVAMLLFGVRSLVYGKVSPVSIAIILVPGIVFVLLGLVMGDWTTAAIWTLMVMFALATLSLFLSGIRGLFS
jgi:hypothetical protein